LGKGIEWERKENFVAPGCGKIEDRGSRIENMYFKKGHSAPWTPRILAGVENTGVSAKQPLQP
jgi:hypothetical protein